MLKDIAKHALVTEYGSCFSQKYAEVPDEYGAMLKTSAVAFR